MLVEDQRGLMRLLANALLEADEGIVCCERCGGITEGRVNPCRICTGERAEGHVLCVVEAPSDILKIESSGGFKGRYHALMRRRSIVLLAAWRASRKRSPMQLPLVLGLAGRGCAKTMTVA